MEKDKKKTSWIDQVAQTIVDNIKDPSAINNAVYGAIGSAVDKTGELYDDVKNYFYPQPKLAQPPGTQPPVERDPLSRLFERDKNKVLKDRREETLRKQGLL